MHRGYIRLWRKITEWEWYNDLSVRVLFFHLLIKANHKEKKWKGIIIKRGEVLTGLHNLSLETKLSIQNIRTALSKLKSTNEITIKTTNKYRIIKLLNYDDYNDINNQPNKQLTNNQQTTNKQLTTTKNEKNEKNEKKNIYTPPKNKKRKKETFLNFVKLTKEEHEKLINDFGKRIVSDYIEKLDIYIGSKGKKYKSHYFTLLSWLRKDSIKKMVHEKEVEDFDPFNVDLSI